MSIMRIPWVCGLSLVYTVSTIAVEQGHLVVYPWAGLDVNCLLKLCFLFLDTVRVLAEAVEIKEEKKVGKYRVHIVVKCGKCSFVCVLFLLASLWVLLLSLS